MTIEQAIKKASESGYGKWDELTGWVRVDEHMPAPSETFLDPLFWQSLGKAMGWDLELLDFFPEWHCRWLGFIDHLASGDTPESFFNQL